MNSASGVLLISALLVEEEQTLAGLRNPRGEVVVLQQGGSGLGIHGIGAEPEVLLAVDKVPGRCY